MSCPGIHLQSSFISWVLKRRTERERGKKINFDNLHSESKKKKCAIMRTMVLASSFYVAESAVHFRVYSAVSQHNFFFLPTDLVFGEILMLYSYLDTVYRIASKCRIISDLRLILRRMLRHR